jgi:hypothetical protein
MISFRLRDLIFINLSCFTVMALISSCHKERATASIRGTILPASANAVVTAIANGDTMLAVLNNIVGRLKIRGLTSTTVDVLIRSGNGYQDTSILAVPLQKGGETDIGTIQLRN